MTRLARFYGKTKIQSKISVFSFLKTDRFRFQLVSIFGFFGSIILIFIFKTPYMNQQLESFNLQHKSTTKLQRQILKLKIIKYKIYYNDKWFGSVVIVWFFLKNRTVPKLSVFREIKNRSIGFVLIRLFDQGVFGFYGNYLIF